MVRIGQGACQDGTGNNDHKTRKCDWVGYIDAVERVARKPNVTGFVANPKSCDARIVVARWRGILEKFTTHIRIPKHPISDRGDHRTCNIKKVQEMKL